MEELLHRVKNNSWEMAEEHSTQIPMRVPSSHPRSEFTTTTPFVTGLHRQSRGMGVGGGGALVRSLA